MPPTSEEFYKGLLSRPIDTDDTTMPPTTTTELPPTYTFQSTVELLNQYSGLLSLTVLLILLFQMVTNYISDYHRMRTEYKVVKYFSNRLATLEKKAASDKRQQDSKAEDNRLAFDSLPRDF